MARMSGLLIGEVAQRAGVTVPTVRYYEEIGLLPVPSRSCTGYRRYSEHTVEELRFIRKAQVLGFSLDEIGESCGSHGPAKRRARTFCHLRISILRLSRSAFVSCNSSEIILLRRSRSGTTRRLQPVAGCAKS
jgi:DNA-binding transcriptional MerR regulator